MLDEVFGVNDDELKELAELFNSDEQQETPPADGNTVPDKSDKNIQTKAFAKRLKESTDKARNEERQAIAKSLGYDSYEELLKSNERRAYEDRGLDHDEVSPLVEELVKQRLDNDPRMKELELFRKKQEEEFGKKELAEITKLTNGEITSLAQLPSDVIELWKTKGSLKAAYLELKGEELILKERSKQSKGSTGHLDIPSGAGSTVNNKRHLTAQERKTWKFFNPKLTDKELDEIMVDN